MIEFVASFGICISFDDVNLEQNQSLQPNDLWYWTLLIPDCSVAHAKYGESLFAFQNFTNINHSVCLYCAAQSLALNFMQSSCAA